MDNEVVASRFGVGHYFGPPADHEGRFILGSMARHYYED
jgi:hypothetical protein